MSLKGIEKHLRAEEFSPLKRNEVLITNQQLPLWPLIQYGLDSEKLLTAEQKSHSMDKAFLRWQRVRLAGVPINGNNSSLVTCQTGLEGYLDVKSAEQLASQILSIGENIWSNIGRAHKNSYKSRNMLEKTILGDGYSLQAAVEWSNILGALLARMRCQIYNNDQAKRFQEFVRREIEGLPHIKYGIDHNRATLLQEYKLPVRGLTTHKVEGVATTDEQQLYWMTMQNLGMFGHPLVRSLLKELYR